MNIKDKLLDFNTELSNDDRREISEEIDNATQDILAVLSHHNCGCDVAEEVLDIFHKH